MKSPCAAIAARGFVLNLSDTEIADLIDVANALADVARTVTLQHFRTADLVADNKRPADFDPVTEADRGAERAMREVLAKRRPQDGIYGEEYGQTPGTSGLTWVLDPVDGTRAFISGVPCWGVLIGLDAGDGPILGIVDQPYTQERFIGGFGLAELRATKTTPLRTRQTKSLTDAILFTTFPEIGTPDDRKAFEKVRDQVRLTRYGLDCYAYALVALGQIDLVIEAGLNPYDIQGPQAVIEAAGGIVTTWDGGPAHKGGRILAAANKDIHAAAMALLA